MLSSDYRILRNFLLGILSGSFIWYCFYIASGHGNATNQNHRMYQNNFRLFQAIDTQSVNKSISIYCILTPFSTNSQEKAKRVKKMLKNKCDKVILIAKEHDLSSTSSKSRDSLKYIFKHYGNNADWFVLLREDTFPVVDNIRNLMLSYNSSEAIYFSSNHDNSWSLGGTPQSDLILSKRALKILVKKLKEKSCPRKGFFSPININECLLSGDFIAVSEFDKDYLPRVLSGDYLKNPTFELEKPCCSLEVLFVRRITGRLGVNMYNYVINEITIMS